MPSSVVKMTTREMHTWMLNGMLFGKLPDPAQQRFINAQPCYLWNDARLAQVIRSYETHMKICNFATEEIHHMRQLMRRHFITKPKERTHDEERDKAHWNDQGSTSIPAGGSNQDS